MKVDNFLYRHFKQTYLRHKLELKWIQSLQTPHLLCFNDNIHQKGNISRLPDPQMH